MAPSSDLSGSSLAILGAGAVARAFAVELSRAGAACSLWSRTPDRAQALLERIGLEVPAAPARASAELAQALEGVEVLLLCVADDAIGELAERCARSLPGPDGVALHPNGYLGRNVLAPLARAGWSTGVLHPLVALPALGDPENRLRRAWFATLGDERARLLCTRLIRACRGFELALDERAETPARYHAALSLLAGGTVALFDAALEVLETCADPTLARSALAALLSSSAANLTVLEPAEALTGPVARGSVALVRGHVEALAASDPELARLYRVLARRMLGLAAERGTLTPEARAELERLIG